MGEGMEEDGTFLCGGDVWFQQLLKVSKGGKGKFELLEIFTRGHELLGVSVHGEVMGKAVACLDAVWDKS